MSGRVASPLAGFGNVEVIHQKLVDNRKRRRSKNVSWPTEDKLCQVRLFAAEDAPSFSGAILQDLLQEKRTGFMHVVAPISADDLPPGFEGVPAKRARLADEAVAAMIAQTVWRPPERFSGDSSLVAVGELSSEVSLQQQREVRVLEAVYPRPSAIPPSPAEPQELQVESDGTELPQIPLIPVEDEDEGDEDDEGAPGFSEQYANQISNNHLAETGKQSISATGQPNIERATAFFKNADLDVAAAAAAAYAVVKAKETGKFIEPDLLMGILRNPRLLETLATVYPSLKNHSLDLSHNDIAPGRSCEPSLMQSHTGSSTSSSPHVFPERVRLPLPSEGQAVPPSHGQAVAQTWDNPARALPQGRNPMTSGPFDQLSGMTGLPGQTRAIYIQGRCYPVRRDVVKEPLPQHPFMGGINEVQARQHASMSLDEAEWYRSSSFGSRGQLWTTKAQSSLSASAQPFRNVPSAGPKIRKPCLYFNTARGCRNGAKCYYMHDTAENPCFEGTKTDVFQLQHARTATLETEYRQ